ncbi:MAG: cache domain-containing protein [Desulfovibrio sp.]|nr:cache domain-containing protein [Desulfovibrio sp.]MBI4958541.1 cache domain-containing protein [Desulfovibrio sp.]
MLRRVSIAARLFGLVGLVIFFAVAALVCATFISVRLEKVVVHHTQDTMLQGEKSKLKAAAHSMALTLGEALKFARSDYEKKALVREILNPVRFEDDSSGYFFVYQGTTNVALPPRSELEGKDLSDFVDANGVYYVRELARQAGAGGGYVHYVFPKPSGPEERKLSYSEMIPGTDLWVGTGVYIDNVAREEAKIASEIGGLFSKAATVSAVLFIIMVVLLCALCLAIAHSVARPLLEATNAAERIAAGDFDIRLSATGSDEASRLQAALISMSDVLRQNIKEIQARREEAEEKAALAQQALLEAQRAGREVVAQVALRIESLQKISSAVAHQLRNPTTIIGGLAGLLMKKPSLKQQYLEYLDGIIAAAMRIERITAAVKEYSAIHLAHLAETSAGEILSEAHMAGEEAARSLGRKVTWEVEGGDLPVFADKSLLAMALREVVVNAVEALPDTGGTVRLEAKKSDTGCEIAVTDDGHGIPEAELQYVLDPFFTTKAVGVGMGLTKAHRAVQEHGGTMEVQSVPAQGTTVTLILPAM